jgi:4-amino-4-deoxy-L-arabinose transferase-like glycosyltransferase
VVTGINDGRRLYVRRALLLIILFGIAIRLGLIAIAGPPERFEYDDLARNLISGRGYVYDQLGTPYRSFYAGLAYVGINAATDWMFSNSPKAMTVVQSLYAGLLALVVFQISRRFFDERLAVVSAALVLLHPSLLYYDTHKLHPLGFDALMMMTAVWLLLRLRDDPRISVALVTGAVFGLAIFQRGSMALFLVGGVVWLVWTNWMTARPEPLEEGASARGSTSAPRAHLTSIQAVVFLCGVAAVIVPWAARNYAIHHIVMLESMTPQQFWKGNATYSNGSGYLAGGRNVYDVAPDGLVEEWKHRDETGQFQLFSEEGAAEVRKDPARTAKLMLEKFAYFWTVPPNSGQQYPARYFVVYLAYYVAIVIAAALGMIVAFRQPALRPGVVLVLIYFASLSIVHAIMFVEMRHRWAAEPLMLAFAPAGARALWNRWFP